MGKRIVNYDPIRTLARQMVRSHRFPGNQPPQTLQVCSGGAQYALLVEAQQEADECRGVEAGAGGVVYAAAGVGGVFRYPARLG